MNIFLPVAALMAAIAASAVAVPLIRERRRVLGAAAAFAIVGAAAALYPLWSNWDWRTPPPQAAGPDVAAMVAKLEKRLHDAPDDLSGWLMLGRSYVALQRLDDAVGAYDHARRLDEKSVDALLGLGEAMSLRAGGEITAAAAQLFEDALKVAPNSPKAMLYGGFAAAARGDTAAARRRWQTLKSMHPPPQIEAMLDARIAELAPQGAAPPTAAGEAKVNIRMAPELKSRLTHEAPLFVFAREPGGRGPPLAAKRLTSAAIGTQIQLSAADSMLPGRVLVSGQRVAITARVSFSGRPQPAPGDLYGELLYDVGRDGPRDLVIDRVAE